jgi:hypothetical protein
MACLQLILDGDNEGMARQRFHCKQSYHLLPRVALAASEISWALHKNCADRPEPTRARLAEGLAERLAEVRKTLVAQSVAASFGAAISVRCSQTQATRKVRQRRLATGKSKNRFKVFFIPKVRRALVDYRSAFVTNSDHGEVFSLAHHRREEPGAHHRFVSCLLVSQVCGRVLHNHKVKPSGYYIIHIRHNR